MLHYYADKEFPFDVVRSKALIVECTADGFVEFSLAGRRFIKEFPAALLEYRQQCLENRIRAGTPFMTSERNFDIVFLPIADKSHGFTADGPIAILRNYINCLKFLDQYAGGMVFASGPITQHSLIKPGHKGSAAVLNFIRNANQLNWSIYKE